MTEIKKYYRSIEQLELTEEIQDLLRREFQESDPQQLSGVSRRRFLQLLGASGALASAAGCRWEKQAIRTENVRAANRSPGRPQHFATAMEAGEVARPLLMTTYEGRPVKAEGNPDHPESQGAADAQAQASILSLYDPDRARGLVQRDGDSRARPTWEQFLSRNRTLFEGLAKNRGEGAALVLEPSSSPTLADMVARVRKAWPAARIVEYSPLARDAARDGARLAFGAALRPQYKVAAADVILCLDADLLEQHPGGLRHTREFAARRDPDQGAMTRLYAVESGFSVTGASADHRLALRSDRIGAFLAALEAELGVAGGRDVAGLAADPHAGRFLKAVAEDLLAARGKSLVVAGEHQPALVQAHAHQLNEWLGNHGQTVTYIADDRAPAAGADGAAGLVELAAAVESGAVDTVFVLGGNPVYDGPRDVDFGLALARARNTFRLGLYEDETSRRCVWHLPMAHFLESWGDARSWDGRLVLAQPTIAPLWGGKTTAELLALVTFDELQDGYDLVRRTFDRLAGGRQVAADEQTWRRALHDGFHAGSAPALVQAAARALPELAATGAADGSLELVFTIDSKVLDGRHANNGWLQELPDSLARMTWDNAAVLGPATASRLGLTTGDRVTLGLDGRQLDAAAFVLPGVADGSVQLALGYGRTAAGVVGGSTADGVPPVGFDAYQLRASTTPWIAAGLTVARRPGRYPFAMVQDHHMIDTVGQEGREERLDFLVREADVAHYQAAPDFARKPDQHGPELVSLWSEHPYDGRKWGMAIDLAKCTGCGACVVACQAENNIPIVGKEQVIRGREMHWLRIDRYFRGDVDAPAAISQPVTCQHCDNAPCEEVCPVGATMHSSEGLNDMSYNRCVGTRYCANNCPYKVRRFNYFNYHLDLNEKENEVMKMLFNPEVSIRARGVMEKCTYCTQKISLARIQAKNEKREIRDGEIVPSCAQTCAAQAITFGDLNDPAARVARDHRNQRSYAMLAMLNVKPRTAYLARITNPHPALVQDRTESAH